MPRSALWPVKTKASTGRLRRAIGNVAGDLRAVDDEVDFVVVEEFADGADVLYCAEDVACVGHYHEAGFGQNCGFDGLRVDVSVFKGKDVEADAMRTLAFVKGSED